MKIIITGGTGFIGRNLAERLSDRGHEVTATGRSEEEGAKLRKRGIAFAAGDIQDRERVIDILHPADCLIHCAGKSAGRGSYSEFYGVNVRGTGNIADGCRRYGIKRIIYLSTPSVYFSGSDRFDISEDEPLPAKQFPYGKTKLIAEQRLQALQEEGIETIILRPRAVYGRYDRTITPRILELSEKKRFPLINGGEAMVDITYIGNLFDAVLKSFSAPPDAWNEIYNISNGNPITVREWFSTVLKIFGREFRPKAVPQKAAYALAAVMEFAGRIPLIDYTPAMTRFSVGYMARSMTLSIAKAENRLGYARPITNEEGFARYREWIGLTESH